MALTVNRNSLSKRVSWFSGSRLADRKEDHGRGSLTVDSYLVPNAERYRTLSFSKVISGSTGNSSGPDIATTATVGLVGGKEYRGTILTPKTDSTLVL